MRKEWITCEIYHYRIRRNAPARSGTARAPPRAARRAAVPLRLYVRRAILTYPPKAERAGRERETSANDSPRLPPRYRQSAPPASSGTSGIDLGSTLRPAGPGRGTSHHDRHVPERAPTTARPPHATPFSCSSARAAPSSPRGRRDMLFTASHLPPPARPHVSVNAQDAHRTAHRTQHIHTPLSAPADCPPLHNPTPRTTTSRWRFWRHPPSSMPRTRTCSRQRESPHDH